VLYLYPLGARPFEHLRRLPDSPKSFWRVIPDYGASFV
jgi:hypothetical protein